MVTQEHLDDPLLHAVSASQNAASGGNEQPTLYLNILARRLDVLPDVPAAHGSKPLGFSFIDFLGSPRVAGSAAQNMTEDAMASHAAERIPQLVPGKLAELGCAAEVEEVFQKGAFVILRVTVLQYDAAALLGPEAKLPQPTKGPGCLAFLACCCSGQPKPWARKTDGVAAKVAEKLCESLPEALSEKLSDKDVFVDVVAKTEADEAAYFFVELKDLH